MKVPATNDLAASKLERLARLIQSSLTGPDWPAVHGYALRFLARANRFSRTPGGLGEFLGSTKGSVSQTVAALERQGLVARHTDEHDQRVVRLDLTAAGWRKLQLDGERGAALAMAVLDEKEVRQLDELLDRILMAMIKQQGGRAFGICATCRHFERNGAARSAQGPHRCRLLDVPLAEQDAASICREHAAA